MFRLVVIVCLTVMMVSVNGVIIDCSYHCDALQCPCDCYKVKSEQVRCSSLNVTELGRFPRKSRFNDFDFNKNHIEVINSNQFNFAEFSAAVSLQLAANQIEYLENRSFYGMKKLVTLRLNHNKITWLPDQVFEGLESLERLFINNNQIRRITAECFTPISKKLSLLYLQQNQIETIHKHAFDQMKHLRTLDLSKNSLKRLDAAGLATIPTLEYVFLSDNPWSCEKSEICALKPILERRQSTSDRRRHHVSFRLFGEIYCADKRSEIFELQLQFDDDICKVFNPDETTTEKLKSFSDQNICCIASSNSNFSFTFLLFSFLFSYNFSF